MSVDQLRLPKTTCPLPFKEGATTCTAWISRAMAAASSSVSVNWVPRPRRAPVEVTLPAVATMRLVPRLSIRSVTLACAPAPTPTMAITAPTPMMMPSIVSALRSLFTRSARTAIRTACSAFIVLAGGPDMAPRPPTLGRAPAQPWRASGLPSDASRRDLVFHRQSRQRRGRVLGRRAPVVAEQPAVAEDHDAAGVGGDVRLVRDEHDGEALAVEPLQQREDLHAR